MKDTCHYPSDPSRNVVTRGDTITAYGYKIKTGPSLEQIRSLDLDNKQPVICVDLDNTIHISPSWGDGNLWGNPWPGAKDGLDELKRMGFKIIIYSCRAINERIGMNQVEQIKEWMARHELPFDEIWTDRGKPISHFILDNSAIRFECSSENRAWEEAMATIKELTARYGLAGWKNG